ncbi:hypothetical protein LQ327_01235 [Actinomycetospora endophytica]|uniref:STAS domain-containing protein n=1 Tax=Actinomycetospora endophytica TaxID=2291215 RepID=A0ABS8P198_9PSEU|nr:hypothetical protein [Actinomycetospora endophytica]MCD2192014.1 hypothetical protein [Actinomycetospora endophytica]
MVDERAATHLTARCSLLARHGARRVVIDVSGVARCEPAGLVGLWELHQGRCGLRVRLTGAHWAQFVPALLHSEAEQFEGHYRMIRTVLEEPA